MTTPKKVHLVGICGIGMSGLAQLLKESGWQVSGSDRALDFPENQEIVAPLKAQGITLYPQDGSCYQNGFPDEIVYSTAIEEDNPDFACAPNVRRVHRAEALQNALTNYPASIRVAVMGSAGKTTVSAWLGEALHNLQGAPTILCGGRINTFCTENCVGNFVKGSGPFFVFEADESDKSVLRYHPQVSIIMNIGTDHYAKEELIEVFAQCLRQTQQYAILDTDVKRILPPECMEHLKVITFSNTDKDADFALMGYHVKMSQSHMLFNSPNGLIEMSLPLLGIHNATNALAILGTIYALGIAPELAVKAVSQFHGVWRRFDVAGNLPSGAIVVDDYAHNIEKIESALETANEKKSLHGRRVILFQPHGFGPLKFMREALGSMLKRALTPHDVFIFLPVYYAGGTSSFTPTSEEVANEIKASNPAFKCEVAFDRDHANQLIQNHAMKEDIVMILGARDNSLSTWAKTLCRGE